jgi:hypothetical protein
VPTLAALQPKRELGSVGRRLLRKVENPAKLPRIYILLL